jgi:hypothetical protein
MAANSPGVGQGWKMPFLAEVNCAFGVDVAAWSGFGSGSAMWGISIEWFIATSNFPNPGHPPPPYSNLPVPIGEVEFDFTEIRAGFVNEGVPHVGVNIGAGTTGYFGGSFGNFGTNQSITGTVLYQAKNIYPSGGSTFVVNGSDGIRYAQNGTLTPAGNPPPNATYWTRVDFPTSGGNPPTTNDMRNFNTWSTLVLPYHGSPGYPNGVNAAGICMQFFNGLFCGWGGTWTPLRQTGQPDSMFITTYEGLTQQLFLSGDANTSGAGVPHHYDWVRIMQ